MTDDPAVPEIRQPTHGAFLRHLADRLVAIGTPAAALALESLAVSTETHIDTVEAVIALVRAHEAETAVH